LCEYKYNATRYTVEKESKQDDSILSFSNVYGIKDVSRKNKLPFQLTFSETSFNATVEVDGKVERAAKIGGVIEATAGIAGD
jgi:hypothetical protein